MANSVEPRDLTAFEKAVSETATRTNGLWLSFVLFATYLIIAVGSVSHRQLFLEQDLRLPVLGVDLPLVGFFVAAPLRGRRSARLLTGPADARLADGERLASLQRARITGTGADKALAHARPAAASPAHTRTWYSGQFTSHPAIDFRGRDSDGDNLSMALGMADQGAIRGRRERGDRSTCRDPPPVEQPRQVLLDQSFLPADKLKDGKPI